MVFLIGQTKTWREALEIINDKFHGAKSKNLSSYIGLKFYR